MRRPPRENPSAPNRWVVVGIAHLRVDYEGESVGAIWCAGVYEDDREAESFRSDCLDALEPRRWEGRPSPPKEKHGGLFTPRIRDVDAFFPTEAQWAELDDGYRDEIYVTYAVLEGQRKGFSAGG